MFLTFEGDAERRLITWFDVVAFLVKIRLLLCSALLCWTLGLYDPLCSARLCSAYVFVIICLSTMIIFYTYIYLYIYSYNIHVMDHLFSGP